MRTTPGRAARVRTVTLILMGIVAGSLLSGPAVAHTGKKISHLQGHLDPIYLNETQKAADANQLDGLDSTAFLRSNGKAADSELLDGVSSAGFLAAGGKAVDADKLDNVDSTAYLKFASTLSGVFSCPGASFYSESGLSDYQTGSEGDRYEFEAAEMRCAVSLPNGATVTGVTFTVYDNHALELGPCRILRTDLTPPVGPEDSLSDPISSAGTPGETTLTGTIVPANALIDNASFAYSLSCFLNSGTADHAIFGASIAYNVPASAG